MKPTGQQWRNWKKKQGRYRISQGLPWAPSCGWDQEWVNVQGYEASMSTEPQSKVDSEDARLMEMELERLRAQVLSESNVREVILGLTLPSVTVPGWVTGATGSGHMSGVPTLFLSDLHWGEVVSPDEIGGVNEYNLDIAHERLERCFDTTVRLLRDYFKDAKYPGIVIALGGDMLSGDIHEELKNSNAAHTMEALIDLRDCLVNCIRNMADEFGSVFIPAVAGNHGRLDKKPIAKGRAYTNWDWLLYQLLDKAFQDDGRVQFLIPSGPDAHYRVYGHRFLLSHGDQFRGGDGMIGHLGPLVRGDHKKRSRNNQIGMGYDTLMVGHFHTLMMGTRFITNGSLIGYNEYAYQGNFGFEEPQQALFITHKDKGITWRFPIILSDEDKPATGDWVSVFKQ